MTHTQAQYEVLLESIDRCISVLQKQVDADTYWTAQPWWRRLWAWSGHPFGCRCVDCRAIVESF